MKKRYLFISIALCIVIGILYFNKDAKKKNSGYKKPKAGIVIEVTQLKRIDININKNYIGTLYPSKKFNVTSRISGRVKKLHYDIGDPIENAAVIAELEDTLSRLEYEQVRGNLKINQSKMRQKELAISLAENEFNRMLALRDRKVISESDLEKAKFRLEQEKITYQIDKANLASQQTEVQIADFKLQQTKITAFWSNAEKDNAYPRIVGERFVDEGTVINPNTPIVSILDIKELFAEIFVGEKEYPNFRDKMKVKIKVDSHPKEEFVGIISRIAPFINDNTRQAKVQIKIQNPDSKLRPGMFARCSVNLKSFKEVPTLHKRCIVNRKDLNGVYIYNPETQMASFQPVQLGKYQSKRIEILNPEALDDKWVVSTGQHILREGEKVSLLKQSALTETVDPLLEQSKK